VDPEEISLGILAVGLVSDAGDGHPRHHNFSPVCADFLSELINRWDTDGVDGARLAAGTTFDMSNLTAGEQQMQPYFSLDKASGTGLGDMNIDYVKIWHNRS